MRILRFVLPLTLVAALAPAQVFNPANGHVYVLSGTATTIQAARAAATAAGGYLVAINDAAENAFLQANFTGRLWIGFSDELVEGTFAWDSGEPVTYTNWCAGEPNNAGATGEDYVELLTAQGCWNDQPANGNGLIALGIIELPNGPLYQLNSNAAGVDFDGAQATLLGPAISSPCPGASGAANVLSPFTGNAYDLAAAFAPPVPKNAPGSLTTPAGQLVNVDFTQPVLFLIGGVAPGSVPFPGPFAVPFTVPAAPFVVTVQMVIVDPSNADGFSLSQAASLQPAATGTTLPGPNGDDTATTVNLAAPPFCSPGITFFGASVTQLFVISNGRVMTTAADTDFSPTAAEALADHPFVGAWCDLNPGTGGSISVLNLPTGIRVDYVAVNYYGTTIPMSFSVEFDSFTAEVQLQNLSGIAAHTGLQFLGISRGSTGATDPGATSFTAGSGTTINSGAMIYAIGAAGSLASGLNTIRFIPNAFGNYDWLARSRSPGAFRSDASGRLTTSPASTSSSPLISRNTSPARSST